MNMMQWLHAKAAQCRNIADIAVNPEITRLLDQLADEFETKAAALGRDK